MGLRNTATVTASCPRCADTFDGLQFCPRDGTPLIHDRLGDGPEHRPGQVIAGMYRILDRIGEGGMGAVYRVEHTVMRKIMGMKILHQDLCRYEHAVRRFERESRAASLLEHPNCVTVSDFGVTDNGSLYLCMEFLAGKDLFDTLRECRVFSPERAVHVVSQMCAGLAEAHHQGVIHRDLKPENIFLVKRRDSSDFVKILDFGIAKILGAEEGRALTAAGTVFGTPEYLAPEQGVGKPVDHRADLYSIGIIMYRMLVGHLPFRGGDKRALIQRQIGEPPMPFRLLDMRQEVPEALEKVCFKLLAKNPDDRYQTAEEVQEALRRVDIRPPELVAAEPKPEVIWIDFADGKQVRRLTADPGPESESGPGGTDRNPIAPRAGGLHQAATAKNSSALAALTRSGPTFTLGYPKKAPAASLVRRTALFAAAAATLLGTLYGLSTLFG